MLSGVIAGYSAGNIISLLPAKAALQIKQHRRQERIIWATVVYLHDFYPAL